MQARRQKADLDDEGRPPPHAGPYDPPKDVPPCNAHRGEEVQNAKPEGLLIRGRHIINEWPCEYQLLLPPEHT